MTEYMTWYLDRPDKWKVLKLNAEKFQRNNYRLTVDTESDLKVVKKVYNKLYKGLPIDSLKIISFLDKNKKIVMLNNNIKHRLFKDFKDKVDVRTVDEVGRYQLKIVVDLLTSIVKFEELKSYLYLSG